MNAYERHRRLVHDYLRYYARSSSAPLASSQRPTPISERDIIQKHYEFIPSSTEPDESLSAQERWERSMCKKYMDRLYKEYTIVELSQYKKGHVAMRWRVEKEVVSGKGQFVCGNVKCDEKKDLKSWEVPFVYKERGEMKQALVKARLCSECSRKLNYRKMKDREKEAKKEEKYAKKRKLEDGETSLEQKEVNPKKEENEEEAKKSSEAELAQQKDEKDKNIWQQPVEVEEEPSKEDEFDAYFADLFA